jgi:hypothetical protein
VSFNPRVDDDSMRMNSIAYEYALSITGEIFIAEGVFQQNRPLAAGHHLLLPGCRGNRCQIQFTGA